MTLNLYTTSACHLCDQASALLGTLQLDLVTIDIADSDLLVAKYGIRIPVLQRTDTLAELNWPFTMHDVQQFVRPNGTL